MMEKPQPLNQDNFPDIKRQSAQARLYHSIQLDGKMTENTTL